jgi:nucleoside-diphosphate-sugar epimerase
MEQMLSNRDVINLTQGNQRRDFIYIDDVVSVYLLILRKHEILSEFSEFDVGTGEQISIREFVLKLKDTMELIYNKPILMNLNFGAIPYRKGEMMEVVEDVNPLFNLGWKPNIMLAEGLKSVVNEFRDRGLNR